MQNTESARQKMAPQKSKKPTGKQSARRWRKRKVMDQIAKWIVHAGGSLIIASVAGLLLLFIIVIWPLWQDTKVGQLQEITPENMAKANKNIIAISADEYEKVAHILTSDGAITFYNFEVNEQLAGANLAFDNDEKITSSWRANNAQSFAIGTNQGRVFHYSIHFNTRYNDGQRSYHPTVDITDPIAISANGEHLNEIAVGPTEEGGLIVAAISEAGHILFYGKHESEDSFFDEGEETESYGLIDDLPAKPQHIQFGEGGLSIFISLENGQILKYKIDDLTTPDLVDAIQASERQITVLGFLLGQRSLVVGTQSGDLSIWFEAFDPDGSGPRKLRKAHTFTKHASPIISFSSSQRNRTFLAGSEDGVLSIQHATNERLLWQDKISPNPLKLLTMTPKNTGILIVDSKNSIFHLPMDNPHPEASFSSFFSKIWYEGYSKPEYIWQSSGGSDDFEPKLSLIPLIFGTFKGTFYALLFALPIAILSAIYVSQFMHWSVKNFVKPSMEIMAALPSVVIGFIGGLWLAPRIQPILPGVIAAMILVPAVAVFFSFLWRKLPDSFQRSFPAGSETFILAPLVLLTGYLCITGSHFLESSLFAGDFQHWLNSTAQVSYDQRNAFVVGLVMGFAVIPIIFTIAEDALSNVPRSLSAASLALGATPWQTAWYIVLPTASPGIFSAAMIGLGRAVGETMIVLMATGNTPVMDWNIFNGFRTLSANIAVEIPEAPMGGTLFRTLFFAALLLFGMTFIVNTGAELVRQRVQKKYGKL
ncbi:MAG: ABC transporter permease subunit [Calditrichaeota bacterium]|nr:MAG: ABC transporter permease subunit [Calditrichota bacterium]